MKKNQLTVEIEGQHQLWNNKLNDCLDEIAALEAVLPSLSDEDKKTQLEHFQNQFIIQRKEVADIKNMIQKHELHIARSNSPLYEDITDQEQSYHVEIKKKVEKQQFIFKQLTEEFEAFSQG